MVDAVQDVQLADLAPIEITALTHSDSFGPPSLGVQGCVGSGWGVSSTPTQGQA